MFPMIRTSEGPIEVICNNCEIDVMNEDFNDLEEDNEAKCLSLSSSCLAPGF